MGNIQDCQWIKNFQIQSKGSFSFQKNHYRFQELVKGCSEKLWFGTGEACPESQIVKNPSLVFRAFPLSRVKAIIETRKSQQNLKSNLKGNLISSTSCALVRWQQKLTAPGPGWWYTWWCTWWWQLQLAATATWWCIWSCTCGVAAKTSSWQQLLVEIAEMGRRGLSSRVFPEMDHSGCKMQILLFLCILSWGFMELSRWMQKSTTQIWILSLVRTWSKNISKFGEYSFLGFKLAP